MSNNSSMDIKLDIDDSSLDLMDLLDNTNGDVPSSDLLFGESEGEGKKTTAELQTKESFDSITKLFEDRPSNAFKDKSYYQKALSGENEESKRFHKILTTYLNANDNKLRSEVRPKLISAYWNLAENIAKKIHSKLPIPKRFTLRFGAILPNLLSQDLRDLLSRVIDENTTHEPIHYVDEWLMMVANGDVSSSATDEIKPSQAKKTENIKPQIEKYKGQVNAFIHLIKDKQRTISTLEDTLSEQAGYLKTKLKHSEYPELKLPYDQNQKKYLNLIAQTLKDLQRGNKELSSLYSDLDKNSNIIKQLEAKSDALGQ